MFILPWWLQLFARRAYRILYASFQKGYCNLENISSIFWWELHGLVTFIIYITVYLGYSQPVYNIFLEIKYCISCNIFFIAVVCFTLPAIVNSRYNKILYVSFMCILYVYYISGVYCSISLLYSIYFQINSTFQDFFIWTK